MLWQIIYIIQHQEVQQKPSVCSPMTSLAGQQPQTLLLLSVTPAEMGVQFQSLVAELQCNISLPQVIFPHVRCSDTHQPSLPFLAFVGSDSFTYTVTSTESTTTATSTATVFITVYNSTSTPPVNIPVLPNDYDIDSSPLDVTGNGKPTDTGATVTENANTFIYTG